MNPGGSEKKGKEKELVPDETKDNSSTDTGEDENP